jgi:hypothetical protein
MWLEQRKPKNPKSRREDVYCIEGEPVTIKQIAARTGITRHTAHNRLTKARRENLVVNWELFKP